MPGIDSTAILHPGVDLPPDADVGEFVVIGVRPRDVAGRALRTRIGRGAVIRSHTVIYAGNRIGSGFQTGHGVLLRESNTIGNNVSIGSHSIVEHHVRIGDGARIHSNAFVPEFTTIGPDAWIGPAVVLTNARYPRGASVKRTLAGPRLMRGAKIGAGAVLLPGVVIGAEALVGAGAVVVENVPAHKVVVGNPARIINDVRDLKDYAGLLAERTS